MALTLDLQVAAFRPGDHVCLLYHSLDEQMTAVAPYLRAGLGQDELCLFVGDAAARRALAERLTSLGVDVAAATAAQRLRMLEPEPVYLAQGRFDPSATLSALRRLIADAKAAGFSGVRTAGDMSWILHAPAGSERVIEYEEEVNALLAESPFIGLCQYDCTRHQPRLMVEVLRSHPIAALGDRVCSNPYFEPRRVRNATDDAERLRWMIGQLQQTRAVELGAEKLHSELENMVNAASHDLKEPVRLVRMHLDLLSRQADRLDQLGRDRLGQAQRSAERLGELVEGILDVAVDPLTLEAAEVPLDAVAADAIAALAAAIDAAGAEVAVGALPTVRGDRALLRRVFLNLISNAIKFRRGPPRIAVGGSSTADRHLLWVRDDGIGIPSPWLPHVFGMFKRLHAREAYPGQGIGLALCRRIVELHHGRIWVESREGEGSTFFVALPR